MRPRRGPTGMRGPSPDQELLRAAYAGREPAESLSTEDREQLLTQLVADGWTVAQIAAHTRTSTYTVGRILARVAMRKHVEAFEARVRRGWSA